MNVLLITNHIGRQSQIGARRNNIILKSFVERGHKVVILHINVERADVSGLLFGGNVGHDTIEYVNPELSLLTKFVGLNLESKSRYRRFLARILFNAGLIDHYGFSWLRLFLISSEIIKGRGVDVIVSSSPSFICPSIGFLCNLRHRIPLVSDNRDWWSLGEYNKSKFAPLRFVRGCIERLVHRSAALISTTGRLSALWGREKGGFDNVMYFYSGSESKQRRVPQRDYQCIVYAGSMYGGRRKLDVLLESIQKSNLDKDIEIDLIGAEVDVYNKFAEQFGELNVNIRGALDKVYVDEIAEHSIFSIILHGDTEFDGQVIPGKFFEFLEVAKPIICVGAPDSEIGLLIERYGLGICSLNPLEISMFINKCISGGFNPVERVPDELLASVGVGLFVERIECLVEGR